MSKVNQKKQQSSQLKSTIEDEEKELEVIKEILEKGNFSALENLPLNLPKKQKVSSARVPKKLSQKEIDKREYRKMLKEVEQMEIMQKKLFAQRKGKLNELKRLNPLEPIKKKNIRDEVVYENKLLKECREMFSKEGPKNKKDIEDYNLKTQTENKNNIIIPKDSNISTPHQRNSKENFNEISRKSFHKEKIEIECDPDKQKDEEFQVKMTEEEREFYLEQAKELFEFLTGIYLSRYIEDFVKRGFSLFEDILKQKKNIFADMNEPFLNKLQQRKFNDKLEEVRRKKKADTYIKQKQKEKEEKERQDKQELERIEKAQAEEFKKAVQDFRNNKNKTFTDFGINTKEDNVLLTQAKIYCCWNCFKPISTDTAIIKKYKKEENSNEAIVAEEKAFCSEKCIKAFETKQKCSTACLWCNKIFDLSKGFLVVDGFKFCSSKCKKEYIKNKEKEEKFLKKEKEKEQNSSNNKNEEIVDSNGDDYDPMEDF